MMYSRRQKGEGKDMGGHRVVSRTAGLDTDMLSPLGKALVVKQAAPPPTPEPTKFRDRSEIKAMRERSDAYKASMPKRETPEMVSKRLSKRK